jgi:hypothetical protein
MIRRGRPTIRGDRLSRIRAAADDLTGDDPILMAAAAALSKRWEHPDGAGALLVLGSDSRTVAQVVLRAALRSA